MILRWALAVLAVLGGFLVAGVLGALATGYAGLWHRPGAGFSAAFAVVVVAYLAAPSHKLFASTVALVLGAVVAWVLLEPSYYPESYRERGAYEPTHLPVIATYVGGLLGLLVSSLIARLEGRDNTFKPTPPRGAA